MDPATLTPSTGPVSSENDKIARLEAEIENLRAEIQQLRHALKPHLTHGHAEPGTAVASSPCASDVVRLNVGGISYCTTRSTLTKIRDSMLGAMFSGQFALNTDQHGQIFIDRDVELFAPVLSFLRNGRWALPTDSPLLFERIRREAEYFGLPWPEEVLDSATVRPVHTVRLEEQLTIVGVSVFRGWVVAGCSDRSIRVFSADGIFQQCLNCGLTSPWVSSSDNRLFAWSDNKFRVWNRDLEPLPGTDFPEADKLKYFAEWLGWFACGTETGEVRLLDLASFRVCGSLAPPEADPACLLIPWNRLLVVAHQSCGLRIWDQQCSITHELRFPDAYIIPVALDRLFVTLRPLHTSETKAEIRAYSADDFRPVLTRQMSFKVGRVAEWEDHFVTVSDDRLLVYDEHFVCLSRIALPTEAIGGRLAASGSTLAILHDHSIVFWCGHKRPS
eukprot:TRINITY_DN6154_c0_g1_i2.p1 TRINITY_DN6154_c0_g1~~TRINITY_DN6154_c0_g1_i2.p1  ORF type:complete len:446 (+),score=28.11 TRINITY_DN6154_c0_g1_i2:155-1492(+)